MTILYYPNPVKNVESAGASYKKGRRTKAIHSVPILRNAWGHWHASLEIRTGPDLITVDTCSLVDRRRWADWTGRNYDNPWRVWRWMQGIQYVLEATKSPEKIPTHQIYQDDYAFIGVPEHLRHLTKQPMWLSHECAPTSCCMSWSQSVTAI